MLKPNRKSKTRGQALAEFGLIAPLLLFLILGIADFGRALFTYAMASNALRDAVRYAEVLGYSGGVPRYIDCASMNKAAKNVFFVNSQSVTIKYQQVDKPPTDPLIDCSVIQPSDLKNGDLLIIESKATVNFITPFLNSIFHGLTFDFKGQRTILKDLALNPNNPHDTDYDGLDDTWETAYFGNLSYNATDDPDNDGCNNGCEVSHHTDPNNPDTDNDGLKDGDEITKYLTDPLKADTDGDGLKDGQEVNGVTINGITSHSDPLKADTDGDGLDDGTEVNGWT